MAFRSRCSVPADSTKQWKGKIKCLLLKVSEEAGCPNTWTSFPSYKKETFLFIFSFSENWVRAEVTGAPRVKRDTSTSNTWCLNRTVEWCFKLKPQNKTYSILGIKGHIALSASKVREATAKYIPTKYQGGTGLPNCFTLLQLCPKVPEASQSLSTIQQWPSQQL